MVQQRFFFLIAVVAGFLGLCLLSQATMGAVLVAFGCLFGILSRITQAERHHDELLARLRLIEHASRAPGSPGNAG